MASITLKVRQIRLAEVKIECEDSDVLDWIEHALRDSFADSDTAIDNLLEDANVESVTVDVDRTLRYGY